MNKIVIIIALIIGVGVYTIAEKNKGNNEEMTKNNNVSTGSVNTNGTSSIETTSKEFSLEASNFKYSLGEIKVAKGDKVKITLQVTQGMHDWKIDAFNAATNVMQTGGTETIEFTADTAGEFEYYCSVGSHRAMGMVGKLIVEE